MCRPKRQETHSIATNAAIIPIPKGFEQSLEWLDGQILRRHARGTRYGGLFESLVHARDRHSEGVKDQFRVA
jgi:hypothetical protein